MNTFTLPDDVQFNLPSDVVFGKEEEEAQFTLPPDVEFTLPEDVTFEEKQSFLDSTQEQYRQPTQKTEAEMRQYLPENILGIENKGAIEGIVKLGAATEGAIRGLTSVWRGGKQLLGIDEEENKRIYEDIQQKQQDPLTGSWHLGGEIAGQIAEPVGALIPVVKFSKLGTVGTALGGGLTASTVAGLEYAPEEHGLQQLVNDSLGTSFDTRTVNMLTAGLSGAAISPVIDAFFRKGDKLSKDDINIILQNTGYPPNKEQLTGLERLFSTANKEWKEVEEVAKKISQDSYDDLENAIKVTGPEIGEALYPNVWQRELDRVPPAMLQKAEKIAKKINKQNSVSKKDLVAFKRAMQLHRDYESRFVFSQTDSLQDIINRNVGVTSKAEQARKAKQRAEDIKAAINDKDGTVPASKEFRGYKEQTLTNKDLMELRADTIEFERRVDKSKATALQEWEDIQRIYRQAEDEVADTAQRNLVGADIIDEEVSRKLYETRRVMQETAAAEAEAKLEIARAYASKELADMVQKEHQVQQIVAPVIDDKVAFTASKALQDRMERELPDNSMTRAFRKSLGKAQSGNITTDMAISMLTGGASFIASEYFDDDDETGADNYLAGFLGMMTGIAGTRAKSKLKASTSVDNYFTNKKIAAGDKYLRAVEYKYAQNFLKGMTPEENMADIASVANKLGKPAGRVYNLKSAISIARDVAHDYNPLVLATDKDTANFIINGYKDYTTVDKVIRPMRTVLQKISPKLYKRVMELETETKRQTAAYVTRVDTFINNIKRLDTGLSKQIHAKLLNREWEEAAKLTREFMGEEAVTGLNEVRNVLTELGERQLEAGVIGEAIQDYFPRIVRDVKKYKRQLGTGDKSVIQDLLDEAAKKKGTPLTEQEAANVVNRYMDTKGSEFVVTKTRAGHVNKRTIHRVSDRLMHNYFDIGDTLHSYIEQSTRELEKARFFGKDYVKTPDQPFMNINTSVDSIGKQLIEEGLPEDQLEIVKDILKVRFGRGEMAPNKFISGARNLMYGVGLGGLNSALVQGGDVLLSVYTNGFANTAASVAQALTGNALVKPRIQGLINHASQDMVSNGWTERLSSKLLKLGTFQLVDNFGKTVNLGAALKKAQQSISTEKGLKRFTDKYSEMFGNDFTKLVNDIADGNLQSKDVSTLLFMELSRTQPISLLGLPREYLNNPNLRPLWMFKSFLLTQIDLLRTEGQDMIIEGTKKKDWGKVREGVSNFAALTAVLTASGLANNEIREWLSGEDTKISDMNLSQASQAVLFKMMGADYNVRKELSEGNIGAATAEVVGIPYSIIDRPVSAALNKDAQGVIDSIQLTRSYRDLAAKFGIIDKPSEGDLFSPKDSTKSLFDTENNEDFFSGMEETSVIEDIFGTPVKDY